jgi:hypothetical protein
MQLSHYLLCSLYRYYKVVSTPHHNYYVLRKDNTATCYNHNSNFNCMYFNHLKISIYCSKQAAEF